MNRNPENESEQISFGSEDEAFHDADTSLEYSEEEDASEEKDSARPIDPVLNEHEEVDSAPTSKEKDPIIFTRTVFEYLELFVTSLCVVFLIFMFGLRLCNVRGESMEKTLYAKEKLLISNLFYEPKREDIIVFHQTGDYLNEPVVKRVIATGGETVILDYRANPQSIVITVYNDTMTEVLDQSSYAYYDGTHVLEYNKQERVVYHVPEGYLFVLGDNRNNSADSRSPAIGLVDERRVLGRVILRISPFSRFGAVD